jgi:hypothetical protein
MLAKITRDGGRWEERKQGEIGGEFSCETTEN